MNAHGGRLNFPWFAAVLSTTVIAFSAVGSHDDWHSTFVEHLGISWDYFASWQIYRLVTGPLIQTKEYVDWSILVLLLGFIPPYELLRGWWRTALVFFWATY